MHKIRVMLMLITYPSLEQVRNNFPSPIKDRNILIRQIMVSKTQSL